MGTERRSRLMPRARERFRITEYVAPVSTSMRTVTFSRPTASRADKRGPFPLRFQMPP